MTLAIQDRLKLARQVRGMTQAKLSEASGVPVSTINSVEHGGNPGLLNLISITEALNISIDWLAGRHSIMSFDLLQARIVATDNIAEEVAKYDETLKHCLRSKPKD